MNRHRIWRWLVLLLLSITMFMAFHMAVLASPPPPDLPPRLAISEAADDAETDGMRLHAVGDTLEVFTNTWSYSTIGLVYDPSRDYVRYAHESQSSSHNPTIYDVDYPPTHTLVTSMSLSALNIGWPWQLDNRTGAGYDASTDTYFLPDYNGDLSNNDDNIVEIDVDGDILNAWEMDNEVGSNDSADGSRIDSIIDIAVVPGEGVTPTRYFVTAAYDDAVVYEVVLTKTGTLWTPGTWATVMTYTGAISETFSDNLGIDYDAQNGYLYHSGWHTTTILVTDLDMTPVTIFTSTFDCPGAGKMNSGITFIEGSEPPEIWVTDFNSDQTTRCKAPSPLPPPPAWEKFVFLNEVPQDPTMTVTAQTSDTIKVIDILKGVQPLQLMERWDPWHLELITYTTEPPVGHVVTGPGGGFLEWNVPPAPDVVTMTKWFHVRPSTWTTTLLSETLWTLDGSLIASHPVTIEKRAPDLHLTSNHPLTATAGSVTTYTLTYENLGGYENDVEIRAHFPTTAPIVYAIPAPTQFGSEEITWEIGDLPDGTSGQIDVFLQIQPSVKVTQTVEIDNVILNHVDEFADDAAVTYGIEETTIGAWIWEKFVTVNGETRDPETIVTVETSNTIQVIDVVSPDTSLLVESWNPEHLRLEDVEVTAGIAITSIPGLLEWPIPFAPATITKTFHVSPCTWLETVLWENLFVDAQEVDRRPIFIQKRPSDLWINSIYEPGVDPGSSATFVLNYGNTGGFENAAWITNTFPAEATFVEYESDPFVTLVVSSPLAAKWELGPLADGDTGVITVTVAISENLPPGAVPPIYDYIYDHAEIERDWTEIVYEIRPPLWEKTIDNIAWHPGISFTMQTSDTFEVVDIITGAFDTRLLELWNPGQLELVTFTPSAGHVITQDNLLEWHVPYTTPVAVLTKTFRVKGGAWTEGPLHEELWVAGEFWRERPVLIRKEPPDLRLTAGYESQEVFPGERVTYTLFYENVGGYVGGAWVTSTFPISAPIVYAVTEPVVPQEIGPQGRWARWDVGALETNEGGVITVSVALTEALHPYEVVHTYNYIYDQVDSIYGQVDIEHDWQPISYAIKPVEPTWEKEIWINGEGPFGPGESPYTARADDLITVVDRVHVTAGAPISYTLTEAWSDVLTLAEMSTTGGSILTTTRTLAWHGYDLDANSWHVLTKTFHVTGSDWDAEPLTETLVVVNADPDTHIVNLEFDRGDYKIYLPLVVRND